MVKFAKNTRTSVDTSGPRVTFTSFDGAIDYTEFMPAFHEAGWAAWCAFRLLHPLAHHYFERDMRELFESYKRGERQWVTYNEEKRVLLQKYLTRPYEPKKWRR